MDLKQPLYLLPAFLCACLIFYLSSLPSLGTPPGPGLTMFDKIEHIVEYAIFSTFLFIGFVKFGSPFLKRNAYLLATLVSIAYGITDEIHQSFVPGRSCSGMDLVSDGIGSILILTVWLIKQLITRDT